MNNQNCIFCKIIKGEIPSYKVYEDDIVIAFLDINPINPGHTLVIPKNHFKDTFEVPDAILKHITIVIKKIAPAILKGVGADACNININNGETSGQVVMHAHWHIKPRFKNDGYKLWSGKEYKEDEAKKILQDITKQIS